MSAKVTEIKDYVVESTWKLEEIFGFTGYDDPKIAKAINKGIKETRKFAKNWSNRTDWLTDPQALFQALEEFNEPSAATPALYYLYLKGDLDLDNTDIQGLIQKYTHELSKAGEEVFFFTLDLGKIDKNTQKKFLKSKDLKKYKYFLKDLFASAKYDLSQPEERILSRTSAPRSGLWSESLTKALSGRTIEYRKKYLTLTEANNKIADSTSQTVRQELQQLVLKEYDQVKMLVEPVLNVIAKNRQINDELRGYKNSYEATVKGYDNELSEFESLVNAVTNNFSISEKFYKLSAEILGVDKLNYADRAASAGDVKQKFTLDDSVELLDEVLREFDPSASTCFREYLRVGRIDVYPNKGKRGGAYMMGTGREDLGNFILLNHTDSFNDFMTLAHEFGHAMHSELSTANQPNVYRGYSTAVAETASTFFEQVAFYHLLPQLSEKDQIIALHRKITGAVSTVFRQIAFVNFEKSYHQAVRDQGYVSHQQFQQLMNESVKPYLGQAFELTDSDGSFYVGLASTHLSRPYYVYSYAYGELISMALYQKYLDDKVAGLNAVNTFMSLGSSMKPKDIFKHAGITIGAELWQTGLDKIKSDVRLLKRLHLKQTKA